MRPSRIIAMLAVALPCAARAAELQVTTSTQVLGYSDFLATNQDQGTIAQYLRVNVVSLDPAGKLRLFGYGRLTGQLTTAAFDQRPELIKDSNIYGRLYYLYLDGRDVIPDHLDLRAGRTYVSQAALPSNIDGLFINAKNLGYQGVGATAFGGHRVLYDNAGEYDHPDDFSGGASLYFDTVRRTHVEGSYARTWLQSAYSRDYAAIDVNSVPFDRVNATGRMKYDVGDSRWAELLGNVSVYPFDPLDVPLVVKGEVLVERPTFDQFSFYSFFDVARYQEFSGAVEYEVLEGLRVNGRYAYENFAATKDNTDSYAHVIEGGVTFRMVKNLTVNANYLNRNGFAARLSGFRINAAYVIWKVGLMGGVDLNDFRRDLARSDTSTRYWAGVNYDVNKRFKVSVHAEEDVSFLYSHTFQGIAALIFQL